MKIDLTKLINNFTPVISIDDTVVFDDEYLSNSEIRRLEDVKVQGTFTKEDGGTYNFNINVTGTMILPCSVSLKDVSHHFSIEISEILSDLDEKDENYIKIDGNSIDILPIIWQNIVMEIPMKVISNKLDRRNIAGIGWELVSDDEETSEE